MKLRAPSLVVLLRAVHASSQLTKSSGKHKTGHPGAEPWSPDFWYHVIVSIVLVLAGGIFAGLTLGLMGLDQMHLRVLATSSENLAQKRNAQKVLRLMQHGKHWVLVVLLLSNVIINESLPIFLDSALGGGYMAIAISTTTIGTLPTFIHSFSGRLPNLRAAVRSVLNTLHPTSPFDGLLSEIIPQAVSVRYGLSIGAKCAPFVLGLMYILAPIAWPIAKVLDWVLGTREDGTYKKAELKTFLQFHQTGDEPLRDEEITILNAVLELNTKKVASIMTPLKDTVILGADDILDYAAVHAILQSGYSRFPVHAKGKPGVFIGLLLIKTLLTYDPKRGLPVSSFPLSILPEAPPSINCFQALDYFQTGRAHLLLISRTPGIQGGAIGIITLEDIIEEILAEEIIDETDQFEDNRSKRRARRQTTAKILGGIVELRRQRSSFTETSSLIEYIRSSSPDSYHGSSPTQHYGSV